MLRIFKIYKFAKTDIHICQMLTPQHMGGAFVRKYQIWETSGGSLPFFVKFIHLFDLFAWLQFCAVWVKIVSSGGKWEE